MGRAVGTTGIRVHEYLRKHGMDRAFPKSRSREKHGRWKGGVVYHKKGYRLILMPEHPRASKHTGYVLEHLVVMEKKLGRPLKKGEVVHHKEEPKSNNHPDNLVLYPSNADHLRAELKGKCPKWSPEGRIRTQAGNRRRQAAAQKRIRLESKPGETR